MSEFKGGIYPPHVQKLLDQTNAKAAAEKVSPVPAAQPEVSTFTGVDLGEVESLEEDSPDEEESTPRKKPSR